VDSEKETLKKLEKLEMKDKTTITSKNKDLEKAQANYNKYERLYNESREKIKTGLVSRKNLIDDLTNLKKQDLKIITSKSNDLEKAQANYKKAKKDLETKEDMLGRLEVYTQVKVTPEGKIVYL